MAHSPDSDRPVLARAADRALIVPPDTRLVKAADRREPVDTHRLEEPDRPVPALFGKLARVASDRRAPVLAERLALAFDMPVLGPVPAGKRGMKVENWPQAAQLARALDKELGSRSGKKDRGP